MDTSETLNVFWKYPINDFQQYQGDTKLDFEPLPGEDSDWPEEE